MYEDDDEDEERAEVRAAARTAPRSAVRHALKILRVSDLPSMTRGEAAEAFGRPPGRPAINDAERIEAARRIGQRGGCTMVARATPAAIKVRSVARRIQRKLKAAT